MSLNRQIFRDINLGKFTKPNPYKGDIIVDPAGQYNHPGQPTRIPGNHITTNDVPYPLWAEPNVGPPVMMQPGREYIFPGADYVDEFPQLSEGGDIGTPENMTPEEYNAWVKQNRKEDKKYVEMELSDEEIAEYQKGGYVIEELPIAQRGTSSPTYADSLAAYNFGLKEYLDHWDYWSGDFPGSDNEEYYMDLSARAADESEGWSPADLQYSAEKDKIKSLRVKPLALLADEVGTPVYRKPTKPKTKPKVDNTVGKLPTKKLKRGEPELEPLRELPETRPIEPMELAYRSQTVINPDGTREFKSVPYAAKDMGKWDLMDTPRVVDQRIKKSEEEKALASYSFKDGGNLPKAQFGNKGIPGEISPEINPAVLQTAISQVASKNSVGIDSIPDISIISFDQIYPELRNSVQERYNALIQEQTRASQEVVPIGQSDDYVEMELSDEEIAEYKKGGYVIEELPKAQSGSPSLLANQASEATHTKRKEKIYYPIMHKIDNIYGTGYYDAMQTGEINKNTGQAVENWLVYSGDKNRKMPPIKNELKEVHDKIMSLSDKQIKQILGTDFSEINLSSPKGLKKLHTLASNLDLNISDIGRYINYYNKKRKQGYTFSYGGESLPKYQKDGETSLIVNPLDTNSLYNQNYNIGLEHSWGTPRIGHTSAGANIGYGLNNQGLMTEGNIRYTGPRLGRSFSGYAEGHAGYEDKGKGLYTGIGAGLSVPFGTGQYGRKLRPGQLRGSWSPFNAYAGASNLESITNSEKYQEDHRTPAGWNWRYGTDIEAEWMPRKLFKNRNKHNISFYGKAGLHGDVVKQEPLYNISLGTKIPLDFKKASKNFKDWVKSTKEKNKSKPKIASLPSYRPSHQTKGQVVSEEEVVASNSFKRGGYKPCYKCGAEVYNRVMKGGGEYVDVNLSDEEIQVLEDGGYKIDFI